MMTINELAQIRLHSPEVIEKKLVERVPGTYPNGRKLMIIACDHPVLRSAGGR